MRRQILCPTGQSFDRRQTGDSMKADREYNAVRGDGGVENAVNISIYHVIIRHLNRAANKLEDYAALLRGPD